MATENRPKKRAPNKGTFAPGAPGNPRGRPKLDDEVREYLREHRGPLTIAALKATKELLVSKNPTVRARVANDWLNKVLPDASQVEEAMAWALTLLKQEFADEPDIFRRCLAALAGRAGTDEPGASGTSGEGAGSGGSGEAVRALPAEPAPS